jgi:hypothetical protein
MAASKDLIRPAVYLLCPRRGSSLPMIPRARYNIALAFNIRPPAITSVNTAPMLPQSTRLRQRQRHRRQNHLRALKTQSFPATSTTANTSMAGSKIPTPCSPTFPTTRRQIANFLVSSTMAQAVDPGGRGSKTRNWTCSHLYPPKRYLLNDVPLILYMIYSNDQRT